MNDPLVNQLLESRFHRLAEASLEACGPRFQGGPDHVFLAVVAKDAFDELHLRKVTAGCYSSNLAAIKVFEKAGFVHEGLRNKQDQCNGECVDHVIFSLGSDSGGTS